MNLSRMIQPMASIKVVVLVLSFLTLAASCPLPPPTVKGCNGATKPCFLTKPAGIGGTDEEKEKETKSYYNAIGAIGASPKKDTLNDWKTANGFIPGGDVRAIYYNAGDLNLGRDMNIKQVGANIACYVTNYGPDPNNVAAWFQFGQQDPDRALADAIAGNRPFATVAMEYSPPFLTEIDVAVREFDGATKVSNPPQCPFTSRDGPPSLSDVDTGIDIGPGDQITFSASGQIWAGVCLTGTNGPEGWSNIDNDPKFPLPGSHPFALLGKLDTGYFEIGKGGQFTHVGRTARLLLRTNDEAPGNGTGSFKVHIKIEKANNVKFYVYDKDEKLEKKNAQLDGEGGKGIPQICLPCHGGT